jgi:hypothetical protein
MPDAGGRRPGHGDTMLVIVSYLTVGVSMARKGLFWMHQRVFLGVEGMAFRGNGFARLKD